MCPPEHLPIIVMPDGEQMVADLYIAVGSIVSRQTNGQIYESAYGLRGIKIGKLQTVDQIMRKLRLSPTECVKAIISITRIINQIQMDQRDIISLIGPRENTSLALDLAE